MDRERQINEITAKLLEAGGVDFARLVSRRRGRVAAPYRLRQLREALVLG